MKTKFNVEKLTTAINDSSKDTVHFLDKKTGDILQLSIQGADIQTIKQLKERIAKEPGRFPQIPKRTPRESYKDMEEFIATVTDPKLKKRLNEAIEGQGAFKCFRDVLEAYPREKQKWNGFRNEKLTRYIRGFLREIGVPADELP